MFFCRTCQKDTQKGCHLLLHQQEKTFQPHSSSIRFRKLNATRISSCCLCCRLYRIPMPYKGFCRRHRQHLEKNLMECCCFSIEKKGFPVNLWLVILFLSTDWISKCYKVVLNGIVWIVLTTTSLKLISSHFMLAWKQLSKEWLTLRQTSTGTSFKWLGRSHQNSFSAACRGGFELDSLFLFRFLLDESNYSFWIWYWKLFPLGCSH